MTSGEGKAVVGTERARTVQLGEEPLRESARGPILMVLGGLALLAGIAVLFALWRTGRWPSRATESGRLLQLATLVAAAMAHEHLVSSKTPMDVNLAKQLIILIHDMGMPLDRILMDPTTGALGYGIEYGYSVMERLRLAALQGDSMTQQPMLVTPGEEAWKAKEAKVGEGVPAAWGDWQRRAINWETLTGSALLQTGADIVVLRHPESLARLRTQIAGLMQA